MKNLLILCIGLIVFTSCHNYKKDAEKLMIVRDSLTQEAAIKDSTIIEYLNDFNEIMVTLDSIKVVEKILTVKSSQKREMSSRQKQSIMEDIELLNQLIQKNKDQIASLQRKLNNANFKIGKLNLMIEEFEKMVDNLEKQIQVKDKEILALNQQVKKLTANISNLTEKITVIETESLEKSNTIRSQTLKLNEAYYVVGNAKELMDNGVIERSGGVLGIGRTSTIKEDFNREYFTEMDIRELNYIPLMVKKAEVISVHPTGSFHISGDERADTLFIDNKADFWKAVRYLVVVTK